MRTSWKGCTVVLPRSQAGDEIRITGHVLLFHLSPFTRFRADPARPSSPAHRPERPHGLAERRWLKKACQGGGDYGGRKQAIDDLRSRIDECRASEFAVAVHAPAVCWSWDNRATSASSDLPSDRGRCVHISDQRPTLPPVPIAEEA